MEKKKKKPYIFQESKLRKEIIIFGVIFSLFYISWWFTLAHPRNFILYALLVAGEVFYLFMTLGYWFTVFDTPFLKPQPIKEYPDLDILIPVCGEPLAIIEATVQKVLAMKYMDKTVGDYPKHAHVYLLNDGYVAQKENWTDVIELKKKYPIQVITRTVAGGAKAGNINNALKELHSEFVVIFDADHKPLKSFLEKTLGFFADKKLAFVQTPQFYENHTDNYVTHGAWAQQEFFFGPICRGKNRMNAAFCCGTNVVFRRRALVEAGGFDTANIAEDFATSVNIHNNGWKSLYLPEVLAKGLAPHDLASYYHQQLRWAKGSIDVFFHNNPLFKKNLTWAQRLQYVLSLSYYTVGLFILIDALIPVIYLLTGNVVIQGNITLYILLFVPYIFIILYTLASSTDGQLSFKALQFSVGSFYIQIRAILASLFKQKLHFKVTAKHKDEEKIYLSLVWPHLLYVMISVFAVVFGILREGLSPAVVTNSSWILFNIWMFSAHIIAAFPHINKSMHKHTLFNLSLAAEEELAKEI